LEVLFPKVRTQVFELLFGATLREHYVRELALRSHLTLHTIQDELRKLNALELVTSRSSGLRRYYQANRDHPLYPAISEIVALSGQSPRAHTADLRRAKRSTKKNQRPRRAHLRLPYGTNQLGNIAEKTLTA
jgi:predicted transcriptional regulator